MQGSSGEVGSSSASGQNSPVGAKSSSSHVARPVVAGEEEKVGDGSEREAGEEEEDDVFSRGNQRSPSKRARKRPRASAQEEIGAEIEEDADEDEKDGEQQGEEEGDVGREGFQKRRSGKLLRRVLKSLTQNWWW